MKFTKGKTVKNSTLIGLLLLNKFKFFTFYYVSCKIVYRCVCVSVYYGFIVGTIEWQKSQY